MGELRRYGVLLAAGAAGSTPIVLDLRKAADGRLAGSADWTPVPGDTTVSIDEGTGANITTVPAFAAGRWHIVLTAAELTGKSILVRVADQDGPVIQDTLVEVQTFGSPSAFYPDNYSAQLLPSALVGGRVDANMGAISTDAAAADNLETMLDGTGGQVLSLGQLNIVNSGGSALVATSTGGNGNGILATGNGTGAGLLGQAGATGTGIFGRGGASGGSGGVFQAQAGTGQPGLNAVGFGTGAGMLGQGGATSGVGIKATGGSPNGIGIQAAGTGTGSGLQSAGGSTGIGLEALGGSASGNAAQFTAVGGNSAGVRAAGFGSGAGIHATGGDIGHGLHAQGGTNTGDGAHFQAQTVGDGMELVAAGGGLPLNPAVSGGSGGSTAAEIADAVWDEAAAGHTTPGTFGDYLDAPVSGVTGGGTGGSSQSGFWDYSTTTTMADPGAGRIRFNGPMAAATQIALDDLTSGGTDAGAVLQALLAGDTVYVQDQANAAIASRYTLTAAPVHQTGFWLLAVSVASSAGAPGNNDSLLVNFRTAGATAAEIADAVWDEPLTAHNTAGTAGRAMRLARAQGKGKWQVSGDNLLLYDVDNTTLLATFALGPTGGPFTSRTAVAEAV